MPDTLNSILEEYGHSINPNNPNGDISLAHQKIEMLMLSEGKIKEIVMDCLVGQAIPCKDPRGLHPEELRNALKDFNNRISQAIHNSMLTKLREGRE
jgi:hypothetical protein